MTSSGFKPPKQHAQHAKLPDISNPKIAARAPYSSFSLASPNKLLLQHELASYDNLLQRSLFVLSPKKKKKEKEKKSPLLSFHEALSIGIYFAIELDFFPWGSSDAKLPSLFGTKSYEDSG